MSYKLINTRSPFYVQYSSTEALVSLDLTIWTGTISAKPSTPTYELSKVHNGGAATFEVGELIRDYITQTPSAAGRVWVETKAYDGVAATVTNTYLATEGYTLNSEGMQHDGTLGTVTGYALPEESSFNYRMLLPEDTAGVVSGLEYVVTPSGIDNSASMITYTVISTSATSVQKTENAITYTVTIDRLPCSKYEIAKLRYVNKFGAHSDFYFTLKSKESLFASSSSYGRVVASYDGLDNNSDLHSVIKRVNGVKRSFVLNTDFINEYYVAQLEELFLSEYVWLVYNGETIPVNVNTNTLEKKSHVNDKLIQYQFEVTAAQDYINTVR